MKQDRHFVRWAAVLCVWSVVLPISSWAATRTVDCTGASPGAYKSLQAAINSLSLAGPHEIMLLAGPCVENVVIQDRQRLTIRTQGGVFISPANGEGNAMTISGSTGITLILLGFVNSSSGLVINRNSEVAVLGCTIDTNRNNGLRVLENSTVKFNGAIESNGGPGIVVEDSLITLDNSFVNANGGAGVILRQSRGHFVNANLIQSNLSGVNVVSGSSAQFDAPNTIQNNQRIGVNVFGGGSARFTGTLDENGNAVPNIIIGNAFIGLNIFGGSTLVDDAFQVINNGFGGEAFHAGVRVDDNSSFVAGGTGNISVSGNTGAGIAVTAGGTLDLAGVVVSNNTGDGINLQGNAQVAFLPPNTNSLSGNGGASIQCDATSVFLGDPAGVSKLSCRVSPFNESSVSLAARRLLRNSDGEGIRPAFGPK